MTIHLDDVHDITMSAVGVADRLVTAVNLDPLLANRIGSASTEALLAYRFDPTEDGACRVAAVLTRACRTDTLLPSRLPSGVLAALADYQAMTGQAVAS